MQKANGINWKALPLAGKWIITRNQVNTKSAPNPCTWKVGIKDQPTGAGAFLYHSAFAEPWWYQRFTTQPQHKVLALRGLGAEPSTSFLQNVLTLHCLQLCKMWYICPACHNTGIIFSWRPVQALWLLCKKTIVVRRYAEWSITIYTRTKGRKISHKIIMPVYSKLCRITV